MREVLYVKYNRTRRRDFQTKVEIELVDGRMQVRKSPLSLDGAAFISKMKKARDLYGDYYKNISLIDQTIEDLSLVSPFIKGISLSDHILKESIDYPSIVENCKKWCSVITDVGDGYITSFSMSPEFLQIFGNPYGLEGYCGKAFSVSNVDSIFSNFILKDDRVYAIDTEWFMEVCLPADFVVYRALKMFYIANTSFLAGNATMEEFCLECGIKDEYIDAFEYMDDRFQQYVHGKGREDIYTDRYVKKIISSAQVEDMPRRMQLKDDHIHNLEEKIKEQERIIAEQNNTLAEFSDRMAGYKKALYNPLYASYRLIRKIGKKTLPTPVKKGMKVWKTEGYDAFKEKYADHKRRSRGYEAWIKDIEAKRHEVIINKNLDIKPLISVLVPVYNVSPDLLCACLDSVLAQSYGNFELCVVDDASTRADTKAALKGYEGRDRVKIGYRSENGHISKCTNQALSMATGDFIALLDCDDLLSKDALLEVALAVNENPSAKFLYSDEDKTDETGVRRFQPYFKPDWAPDTLMSLMYTCHLGVFKKSIVDDLGGLRVGYEGSQDYDLVLRVMEVVDFKDIIHIPQILYHWRTIEGSTASDITAKPYIMEATRKAKQDALLRRGLRGEIEYISDTQQFRVRYLPNKDSFVSIIIPSKDNPDIIERCLKSIREKTLFGRYEIIIVDNGSSEENRGRYRALCRQYRCDYIYKPMEFNFSRMCNLGAEHSGGNFLLFLNDDMEVMDGEWLDRMLGQAQLSYAGAVGAKLLYPDSTFIQHIGVLNLAPGPSHALGRMDDNIVHYFGVNRNDTDFLAVTAACLMVGREKFEKVGGFDENLRVAYNDVDLCFKLVEAGYYNAARMDVKLYHYESYSRGIDTFDEVKAKRLASEREMLYKKHPAFALSEGMDPFYNHRLVQDNVDYSYNLVNRNCE